jgi:hypothetical protein
MRDGRRSLKPAEHEPIEFKGLPADLGNHIDFGCSCDERPHASPEDCRGLDWSSARPTRERSCTLSKKDNRLVWKGLGHPSTDNPRILALIGCGRPRNLKNWLRWFLLLVDAGIQEPARRLASYLPSAEGKTPYARGEHRPQKGGKCNRSKPIPQQSQDHRASNPVG